MFHRVSTCCLQPGEIRGVRPEHLSHSLGGRPPKAKKLTPEQIVAKRRKIWISIAKKEIPKVGQVCYMYYGLNIIKVITVSTIKVIIYTVFMLNLKLLS